MYLCMSRHQRREWSFETKSERDAFAKELLQNGFEARHGVYKWNPEHDLADNPYKGLVAKHGNCWF